MRTNPPQAGRRSALLALALALAMPGVLLWSWSRPSPSPPIEVPPLALSPSEVQAQLAADGAAADRAPDSDVAEARDALYAESNAAEVEANDTPPTAQDRRNRLIARLAAVEAEHGAEAVSAQRARDTRRMEEALREGLEASEQAAAIGGFLAMLERYGMAQSGTQTAPRFVVRTAFKARWNVMHGRDATEGMSPVERQAHWGWLALRAETAPLELRLDAAERFADAGGLGALEARGALLVQAARHEEAADAFIEAYQARPSFRLRNHALYASSGGDP